MRSYVDPVKRAYSRASHLRVAAEEARGDLADCGLSDLADELSAAADLIEEIAEHLEAVELAGHLKAAPASSSGTDVPADVGELVPAIPCELAPSEIRWLVALSKAGHLEPGRELEVSDTDRVSRILRLLAQHAADGARRYGAWERGWIGKVIHLQEEPEALIDCMHPNTVPATMGGAGAYCPDCHLWRMS